MSASHRLYDRPWLDQRSGLPALYVMGTLSSAVVQAAFSGRLQIHGAQGACWAELIDGELPPGGAVYVDNTTHEVVVAWPAWADLDGLQNPSLETGDLTGWEYSTIGGSGTLTVSSAHHTDGNYGAYWPGGRGMGSEGGIECVAVNQARAALKPGQRISGSVDIGYNFEGGTPKGSRGQARLHWYDDTDTKIGESDGDLIATRSHNGKWTTSHVTGVCQANAAYARLAAWVTATGAGEAWFDHAQWDAVQHVGTDTTSASTITIRVHDAAGRYADWTGLVQIGYLILTSWLYPINVVDDADSPLATGGSVNNLYGLRGHDDADSPLATGGSVIALGLTATVTYGNHDQPQDDADSVLATGGSVQALALTQTISYGTYSHAPDDTDSPVATGGSVIALGLVVTTGYQTYAHAQDDADAVTATGGSVVALSMTP